MKTERRTRRYKSAMIQVERSAAGTDISSDTKHDIVMNLLQNKDSYVLPAVRIVIPELKDNDENARSASSVI